VRVAILTISDAGAKGERADTSGDVAGQWAVARGYAVADRQLVPDETTQIVSALTAWCDDDTADLVLTTGGTGLATSRRRRPAPSSNAKRRGSLSAFGCCRSSRFPGPRCRGASPALVRKL